jgi:hypothetical protein
MSATILTTNETNPPLPIRPSRSKLAEGEKIARSLGLQLEVVEASVREESAQAEPRRTI